MRVESEEAIGELINSLMDGRLSLRAPGLCREGLELPDWPKFELR